MKKVVVAALLLIPAFCLAKDVKGTVSADGEVLSGVVVTDGRNFTSTDANGNFAFNADNQARFVYIVTPSGYVAPYESGTPVFYKPLDDNDTFEFRLQPLGIPQGDYVLMAIGDTQPGDSIAYLRLENEALPDLKALADSYHAQGFPVVGISLGDLVWDNLETFPHYKQDMASLSFPMYPLIGNHDHDLKVADDLESAHTYEEHFGPTCYAFNVGRDYFIVLDAIVYEGNKKYTENISEAQLQWVEDYKQYIPSGAHVFVAMHAPAYIYSTDYKMPTAERLMDILSDYQVSILSGHTHINSNLKLRPNVREHMIASIGGAWWLWDCPYAKDGTPIGYQVFESKKDGVAWYFKALGHNRDYQLRVYQPGTFLGHEGEVCAKIWNWDETWKVEWYEDGKLQGEMKQFSAADPDFSNYLEKKYAEGKEKVGNFRAPVPNVYFFFAAHPSDNASKVDIVARDGFGNTYNETILIK